MLLLRSSIGARVGVLAIVAIIVAAVALVPGWCAVSGLWW
jgi:hypothetical protein